jgi:hypothetical protein
MAEDKPERKGAAVANIDPALDAVSQRLRRYYDSVKDEAIPDRFLDLLEKLDEADKAHNADDSNERRRT